MSARPAELQGRSLPRPLAPHLEARLASELLPPLLVDAAIVVKHVDGGQVVALASLEVVGVVGWGDLRVGTGK